jgi:hypothetical protein
MKIATEPQSHREGKTERKREGKMGRRSAAFALCLLPSLPLSVAAVALWLTVFIKL